MSEFSQIARLQPVNIRQAWAHESNDFTPWLFDNLDALGEAIGIRLEGEGQEVKVGAYSADIIARNSLDGSRVLIENQLECSDHTHLGQIMTYLAGLEARTIIWVASAFKEEHLSAIKWLNENTNDQFAFFAVRVAVVQIAGSPYAPIFDVSARPNNWERLLHAAAPADSGYSEISLRRHDFWHAFVERVPGELERSGPAAYTSNRWRVLDDPACIISMYAASGYVGIFIRAPHYGSHEDMREMLASKADLIEARLGVPMTDSDRYFFGSDLRGDYNDPAQRDGLIDWLAQKADLYERTIREVLGSGNGSEQQ